MEMRLPKTHVDLLEEDKPLAGQKFVCVSFVSPEKIINDKNLFLFQEFLKTWDFNKSMEKFIQFLNFISYKYHINFDAICNDLKDFVADEKLAMISASTVEDDYKTFLDKTETKLEEKFLMENSFQTTVRGLKVRGVFPTIEEAELRCKMMRELDPNHDVYVGPVGMWMPWHPEAYKTGRVEYLEEELNKLMSEKIKNEDEAKSAFEERLRETKKAAITNNIEKAKKSGNVLTQTVNDEGDLISVNNINTQEKNLNEFSSVSDIRKELFEGDDIVINKK